RVALQVSLPEGFHVQSNKPRDPSLIPTELRIDAPDGVTVEEVVFPPSTDLAQTGADQPLAVFERAFDVGVRFKIASTVAPGDVKIPLHLRYQACDATMCFAPATADSQWIVSVGDPGAAIAAAQHRDLFAGIAFGHGEAPTATAVVVPTARVPTAGDGIK